MCASCLAVYISSVCDIDAFLLIFRVLADCYVGVVPSYVYCCFFTPALFVESLLRLKVLFVPTHTCPRKAMIHQTRESLTARVQIANWRKSDQLSTRTHTSASPSTRTSAPTYEGGHLSSRFQG